MSAAQSPPVISTVLLNHNRSDLLRRALESYRATTTVAYELFIVDSGSSDDSAAMIDAYCREDPHAQAIVMDENIGGEGFNEGLTRCCAPFLHLSENDIEYLPGWAEQALAYFEAFPRLGQLSPFGPVEPDDVAGGGGQRSTLRHAGGLVLYEVADNVGATSIIRREPWDQGVRMHVLGEKGQIPFPADGRFSQDIKSLGWFVALADHYLVRNLGHTMAEFEKRPDYYRANYAAKPWLQLAGWHRRIEAWRNRPKPRRRTFLFPDVTIMGEKTTAPVLPVTPLAWSMLDEWTPEVETLEFLYGLVRLTKPSSILATGTWRGYTAQAIAQALRENALGRLTALEADPDLASRARTRLEQAGLTDWVQVVHGSSLHYVPEQPLDLLVLDSTNEVRKAELLRFAPDLRPGAIVAIHDAGRHGNGVKEQAAALANEGLLTVLWLETPRGLAIGQAGSRAGDVDRMLAGARAASPQRVLFGCIADNSPKYLQQAWRLLFSLRAFGGTLARSDFVVGCVGSINEDYHTEFSRLGAQVRVVECHPNPYSNKLELFRLAGLDRYDSVILLDCDCLVLQDPAAYVSGDGVAAKVADYATVPHPVLQRVFAHFGLPLPKQTFVTTVGREPTIPYVNSGVVIMSREAVARVGQAWLDADAHLFQHIELLESHRTFCDQASLCVALGQNLSPFRELPVEMNLPLHIPTPQVPANLLSKDATIVHYHHRENALGLIEPTDFPAVQPRIDAFNTAFGGYRRSHFNNRIFWDHRFSVHPTVGSGPHSQGDVAEHKRDLIREVVGRVNPRSVLDVGCGECGVTRDLALPGYLGIDISSVVIRKNATEMPDRAFTCGDFLQIDVAPHYLTICLDVLNHQPEQDYRRFIQKLVATQSRQVLVSGFEALPSALGETGVEFFHQPLSNSLREAGISAVETVGTYDGMTMLYFEKPVASAQTLPSTEVNPELVKAAIPQPVQQVRPPQSAGEPSTADATPSSTGQGHHLSTDRHGTDGHSLRAERMETLQDVTAHPQAPPPPPIISVHIPKTGGTTFLRMLVKLFAPCFVEDFAARIFYRPTPGLPELPLRQQPTIPPDTRCIHGHFLATKYREAYPDAPLWVWLRDPVERVVSYYQYYLRVLPNPNPMIRMMVDQKLSLTEFAELPTCRDMQAYMLAGIPLEVFQFVGITEQYERSLRLLQRMLGLAELPQVENALVNPDRLSEKYPLDPALRQRIQACNPGDRWLYEQGLRRFEQLCAQHGV